MLISDFNRTKPFSLFIIHETLPNINVYFETFPSTKVISIKRNPVDLVYSWNQRNLGNRLGKDPLLGTFAFQIKNGLSEWYARNWNKELIALKGIDRVIMLIETIFKIYHSSYKKLPENYKKRILVVRYKNIITNPFSVVKEISKFLSEKPSSALIKQILKKEKLPNKERLSLTKKRLAEIKLIASPKFFNRLIRLEEKYNNSSSFPI
jgi:hypothetical protein